MTFEELLINRRSIRNYTERPVPKELINELLVASQLAPNAGNEQPWKYCVVTERETIRRISDESKKNLLERIAANPDDYATKYRTALKNPEFNVFYNAPCVVMIVGSAGLKNVYVDCALAASYFMLAAADKGLGTCWVNLGREIHDVDLRRSLRIPDDATIVAPIALGYPAKIPTVPARNEPEIL